MKKSWKLTALLLALVMVLAACGGGNTTSTPAESTEGSGETPASGITAELTVQAETSWMDYYQAAIDRVLAANPDSKISLVEVASFDHLDTIDQTGAGNADVADVFAIPADRIYGMVNSESLAAIDSEALANTVGGWESFDAFNQGLGGNFKIDGEYFAFPYNIETLITYINTANAAAKNIDVTQPIDINAENYQTVLLPAFDAWYGVAAMNAANIELLQKDGDTLSTDMTTAWADLPAEKQAVFTALYDYWKANNDNETQLFDADAGWGYIDEQFGAGGNGVFRIAGPWEYAAIAEVAGEENVDVANLDQITIAGQPLKHWKGGWGLAINSRIEGDADKMALAQAVIAEIVNPEYFEDLFKATGKILENVTPEQYQASGLTDTEKKTIVAGLDSYAAAVNRPLFTEYGPVWDTYKNAVLSWNSQNPANAEEAFNLLNSAFTAMMASN